ncbi:MAG: hypothetical protein K2W33_14995 [Burkholderiales bacterium]|nr:hypothetical protein [Burkholderiales bacterium]
MSQLLDGINFAQIDAATAEQKKALLRLAADDLRINRSSPRFHTAYRQVIEEGRSAKDALSDMVRFEDRARQEWVDRSLQPWCDRHGLTLKQGLSVLFDDHPYNLKDPSELVTQRSVLAWSGQQNDFSFRLMEDMKAAERVAAESGVRADVAFEVQGVQRWDVMEGSVDAVPGEPTYTVNVRASSGQIAIEVMSPATAAAVAEVQAGIAVEDSDPRWALPCLEVTLEVNEGLPCIHVHGGVGGELAQTVFALPDAKVAIRTVDDPGMKDAVIAVPDSYMPDFDEVHARFAAVQGVDLAVPADPEAPQ